MLANSMTGSCTASTRIGTAVVVVATRDDDSTSAKTTTMTMTTMDGGVERRSSTSSGTPHSLDLPPVPATVVEQVEDPSQVVRYSREFGGSVWLGGELIRVLKCTISSQLTWNTILFYFFVLQ
jgi:hypothetical protein